MGKTRSVENRSVENTVAQKCHGNFNLLTAISIYSRLFQFTHDNSNLLTAISISHKAISTLLTAISISLAMRLNAVDRLNATPTVS